MTSGTGVFFDGQTSRRQDVHVLLEDVSLEDRALAILRPDGSRLETWPYAELRELPAPPEILRLTRDGGAPLARLEIRDPALAAAARAAAPSLGAALAEEAGTTRRVVLWSLAAVASVTLFALYGVPALADRIAPLLPWSVDRRMGEVADRQIRSILPTGPGGFACGEGSEERPGREALDRMAKRLADAAALPVPVTVVAVRSDFVNALALPGGTIYLFDGLIRRADSAEEIAGVLAHEIGHAAHRDGSRRALQAGGTSLLFGFILGDFVGGTAAITVARVLSEASYSRAAETSADDYAVALMGRLGADPRPLGAFLARLSGEADDGRKADGEARPAANPIGGWIASHPDSADRRRRIDAAAGPGPYEPIVDQADFLAIKRICGKPS